MGQVIEVILELKEVISCDQNNVFFWRNKFHISSISFQIYHSHHRHASAFFFSKPLSMHDGVALPIDMEPSWRCPAADDRSADQPPQHSEAGIGVHGYLQRGNPSRLRFEVCFPWDSISPPPSFCALPRGFGQCLLPKQPSYSLPSNSAVGFTALGHRAKKGALILCREHLRPAAHVPRQSHFGCPAAVAEASMLASAIVALLTESRRGRVRRGQCTISCVGWGMAGGPAAAGGAAVSALGAEAIVSSPCTFGRSRGAQKLSRINPGLCRLRMSAATK